MREQTTNVGLSVLLAVTLVTAACGDAIGPDLAVPDAPAPLEAAVEEGRISGAGTLGSGSPEPGSALWDFDFDVASDLTGRLFFRAWSVVRPDGTVGTVTVADEDPDAVITAFRSGSAVCDDPALGAEFDGIGRLDTGELYGFTVRACDYGPADSGLDYFEIDLPDRPYKKADRLSSGDIVKSGEAPPPGGDLGLTGVGAIGPGSPTPGSSLQDFDFDVASDLSGNLLYRDWGITRADGTVATITVAETDSGTGITAVRDGSAVCADPALGAEFDATGRLDTGELTAFTVRACDNGAADSGLDFFEMSVPGHAYARSDFLSSGDIAKSIAEPEPEPTTGQLSVATATSGEDLDPDGYTITVDGVTSSAVPANGSVTFSELAEGDHSVALSGVASNCAIDGTHPRTVTVPAGGTASTTFDVICAPVATRLVFLVQPSDAAANATITPPVEVMAVNDEGVRVSSFTGAVTIAIGQNGGLLLPGTLSGTKTVSAVDGVATFSDLSIDNLGTYTLRVSTSGLSGAESEPFDIGLSLEIGLL